jgi:hypothetical protein
MIRRETLLRIGCIALVSILVLLNASVGAQEAAKEKPVEQTKKNIQVLQGLPESQLMPVMHFMRASLGVRCDHCHIAENGKYWMDDKPAKQVARQHIRMTSELNRSNFGGRTVVTCNTCHQGHIKPISIPSVEQGVFANPTRADRGAKPPDPLPGADQVIDQYYQAMGGRAALDRIKTRQTRLTLLRPKLVNSGTPDAAMITRGETWSMEVYQKAPDKYLAVVTTPDGVIHQGLNGETGWVKTPDGQRAITGEELARVKRQADLSRDFKLKEQYSKMDVAGKETLRGHEAYVIEALNQDKKREQLFFDAQSGLLLRRIVLTETALGLDPEVTDYEDYRDVDGVKIPFTVRVSYLDDNHLGTTRTLEEVRQNVPIDDARFNPPQP